MVAAGSDPLRSSAMLAAMIGAAVTGSERPAIWGVTVTLSWLHSSESAGNGSTSNKKS